MALNRTSGIHSVAMGNAQLPINGGTLRTMTYAAASHMASTRTAGFTETVIPSMLSFELIIDDNYSHQTFDRIRDANFTITLANGQVYTGTNGIRVDSNEIDAQAGTMSVDIEFPAPDGVRRVS